MYQNKVVLVTGSSRGIGKAIAYKFASNGYLTILNSNSNKSQLLDTYNEFISNGYRCDYIQADVSNYSDVSNMISKIYNLYGKIDILINNAGISYIGLLTDMSFDDWQNIINTNLNSVFNCCRLVVPKMVSMKQGIIINISSIWGNIGASCEAAYAASKGAVNAFTKSLAKELGPSNIRVNAISAGVIETDMNNWLSDDEKLELKEEIPVMYFGKPQDIAEMSFFLSSETSKFITGQVITVDGGMT